LPDFGRKAVHEVDVAYVPAGGEYGTGFAAEAGSRDTSLEPLPDLRPGEEPGGVRHGKTRVGSDFRRTRCSEFQDQTAMTGAMGLALCRRRSPSFDKLCREL
jgi:hypothetical protein